MKVFVTGGGGFLGKAIVRKLHAQGHEVVSYSRGQYPSLSELGVRHISGSLSDYSGLKKAMQGADAVIHVAAKAGLWGSYDDFYSANVQGTEYILKACQELHIPKLVYTSTPSVIYHKGGVSGGDESMTYPKEFDAYYPQTKAIAEQMVLRANSPTLSTVALRPHLIWGPGDPHFIPRLSARAKAGKLRIIGDGEALVDCVYVDNAADAHLLALEKLEPSSVIAGQPYFITQAEPIKVKDFLNALLKAAGVAPVTRHIPAGVAYLIGAGMERFHKLFRPQTEPMMTRFLAQQMATPHWFDPTKARQELGYVPKITIQEGLQRLEIWCQTPTETQSTTKV